MIINRISITGYLVGGLYWPAGCEAWKDLNYSVTDAASRATGRRMTLRDHVCDATNDGDFMGGAVIADGRLEIARTWYRNGRHYRVTKSVPLQAFPSISDMLHPDPDWAPVFADETELVEG